MSTGSQDVRVAANLVLGASGQTTLDGRSAGLSSRFDRARFHEIRKQADVIVIGGATARTEPYGSTPVRLIVLSRSGDIPAKVRENPLAEVWSLSPLEAISRLIDEGATSILIEGGANFIRECSQHGLLNALHLTQSNTDLGENPLEVSEITRGMELINADDSEGESYFFYATAR